MRKTIEELLEMPYWIVDVLPEQVKADSPGQYFAVERYYRSEPRITEIKKRHADLVLKLNCYRDILSDGEEERNPPPERIAEAVLTRRACLRTGDALIVSEPDELYLTVYDPDEELLRLLEKLCVGEGLYLWQPRSAAEKE